MSLVDERLGLRLVETGQRDLQARSMPSPFGIGPMPTRPVTLRSAGRAIYSRAATFFIAPMKQAAQPAATTVPVGPDRAIAAEGLGRGQRDVEHLVGRYGLA